MHHGKPEIVLTVLLLAWLAITVPGLHNQYSQTVQMRSLLSGRTPEERAALFDTPSFRVAQDLQQAVPAEDCVVILAYAGRAAVDYYRARFRYFLYPRRVHLFDNTSATIENCSHVAVFRDSPRNLSQAPFAGSWKQQELDRRLESWHRVNESEVVDVYRAR